MMSIILIWTTNRNIWPHSRAASDTPLGHCDEIGMEMWVELGVKLTLIGEVGEELLGGMASIIADRFTDVRMLLEVGAKIGVAFFVPIALVTDLSSDEWVSCSDEWGSCSDECGLCRCCPTTVWDCRAVQAWMPSYHVWPICVVLPLPQSPNQEPPRAQQLSLPDFWMVPHSVHISGLTGFVITVVVEMGTTIVNCTSIKEYENHETVLSKNVSATHAFFSIRLTFASIHALTNPAVVCLSVDSTTLIPSTTRNATTESFRFLERVTLWAYYTHNRRDDTWCEK